MPSFPLLPLCLLLSLVADLPAQTRGIESYQGMRVRVSGPEIGKLTGDLAAVHPDILLLRRRKGELVALPRDGVRRLEVSQGHDHRVGGEVGIGLGLLAGLGTFTALELVSGDGYFAAATFFGGATGMIIGNVDRRGDRL
jgi:hypothetical protein